MDILQPFGREKLDPVNTAGIPEIDFISISGPFNPTGPGDTPSRRLVFYLPAPFGNADAVPVRAKNSDSLGPPRLSPPVTEAETERLLTYFQRGPQQRRHVSTPASKRAVAFILVNPQFLFRSETDPPSAAPGSAYRISDLELASRLSFFLWSSIPDDQLLTLAPKAN